MISRYREAGVDIDAGNTAVQLIREAVRSTFGPEVLQQFGGFSGLFRLPGEEAEILAATADGVGTKVLVAVHCGRHDTIGEDLVNHCVNDLLTTGARPLFFMDYIAMGKLQLEVVRDLVGGIAKGCREHGCALLGGETAEMPDVYRTGEYDLAGFLVGLVEGGRLLDPSGIRPGDRLIGLASNGLHTNGYSLARKLLFEEEGLSPTDRLPWGEEVGEALLRVHQSYLRTLGPLLETGRIQSLAHITGGGLVDNLPRALPPGCVAHIRTEAWSVPRLFTFLEERGRIPREEMFRTFNMGIGMVAVVRPEEVEPCLAELKTGVEGFLIGEVVEGTGPVQLV